MQITIRSYQKEDWQVICQIHDAARPDELKGSCDPRAFIPLEKDPEVKHLQSCRKLVAEVNGSVVGFVGIQDDYLGWLYVHPDYYGNGVGRLLLREGLELIPGNAWTIALADNRRAVHLYQSEGFSEVLRYQSDNSGYPCTCLRLERPG
jgi:ribosomal protein S18 acetylase RimI-like enzyme